MATGGALERASRVCAEHDSHGGAQIAESTTHVSTLAAAAIAACAHRAPDHRTLLHRPEPTPPSGSGIRAKLGIRA
jgi:hypothetical protein